MGTNLGSPECSGMAKLSGLYDLADGDPSEAVVSHFIFYFFQAAIRGEVRRMPGYGSISFSRLCPSPVRLRTNELLSRNENVILIAVKDDKSRINGE
jgi:hypothetical protein